MQDRSRRRPPRGFTLIEILIVVAVVAFLVGVVIWGFHAASQYSIIIKGGWNVAPATISPAPATGTFIYHVSQQQDAASTPVNAVGRSLKFDMSVTKMDGKIVSCNGVDIPAGPGDKTCTADTDSSGNVNIVVSLEKTGVANLVATDVKSGQSDPKKQFSAP